MINFLPTIWMLILLPLYLGIPAIILYFVIKRAVKKAIRELKDLKRCKLYCINKYQYLFMQYF